MTILLNILFIICIAFYLNRKIDKSRIAFYKQIMIFKKHYFDKLTVMNANYKKIYDQLLKEHKL